MNMRQVKSTTIHAIGYDPLTSTLHVHFKQGDQPGPLWSYAGVPPDLAAELATADSAGKSFHRNIRGKFKPTRLSDPASMTEKKE